MIWYRHRIGDIENILVFAKGKRVGEGWIGSLELAVANLVLIYIYRMEKQQAPTV